MWVSLAYSAKRSLVYSFVHFAQTTYACKTTWLVFVRRLVDAVAVVSVVVVVVVLIALINAALASLCDVDGVLCGGRLHGACKCHTDR